MRRIFIFSVICVLLLSVVGCSDSVDNTQSGAKHTDDTSASVDIDLTSLSSTMVYSEVYNMVTVPDDYVGKTVKMDGQFTAYHDENTGRDYFTCVIADATACCSQGIEFELGDGYSYPDDYPQEGEEICVAGTFDTYDEGGYIYCTLRNARLI